MIEKGKKRLLSLFLVLAMVFSLIPGTAFADGSSNGGDTAVAKVGTTEYTAFEEAIKAALTANDGVPVELLCDVVYDEAAAWTPIVFKGGTVVIDGHDHTVTGLPGMLFDKQGSGGHHLRMSNIVFDGAKVNIATDYAAVIVGYADAMNELYFENVTVKNSTVTGGKYAAAFVGYAAGYNVISNGPVFQEVTFKNCSVENCTISGGGSTGALMGHAAGNTWASIEVEGTTVQNNTVTCTSSSTNKAGSLFGTVGAAGADLTNIPEGKTPGLFVSANVSDNTVTSGGETITTIYGRQGTSTGTLVLTEGGSYDSAPIKESDTWASLDEGCNVVENNGVWAVAGAKSVAQIGSTKYETLAAALIAANSGDTIEILDGTWDAAAVGKLDETGYTNANAVRSKSLTIKAADGATPVFVSGVYLGYDDGSTVHASMTVKGLKFDGAYLAVSNYLTVDIEDCTFVNGTSSTAGTLVVMESACKLSTRDTDTSALDYTSGSVTIKNCSITGSNAGAPGIRVRNSGNVTLQGNTVADSCHNGILLESNSSVVNTFVKNISITENTITEWNSTNVDGGGRGMRLALGTLAAGSTLDVKNNTFVKETLGLDTPDFLKATGVGSATVDLSGNDWNDDLLSTVKGNSAYYTVDATATIDSVVTTKMEAVAQIGTTKYETLAAAIAAVPTDKTETTIVLLDDVTIAGNAGVTIAATQNVVLDLNGHTLKNAVNENKASQVITNRGTLTIKDSSDTEKNGTGTGLLTNAVEEGTEPGDWWPNQTNNYATNVITNAGTLTVQSGVIKQAVKGSICYAVDNNSSGASATLNVEGGLITGGITSVRAFANSTTFENNINVSGGKIEGSYTALWIQLPGNAKQAKKASLTVTGGELAGGAYAFYDYSYGDVYDAVQYDIDGGLFDGDVFSYGANVDISGGVFEGEVAIKQTLPSTVAVTGGMFAGDVYTYGDNASGAFISGGLFKTITYEYEGETYYCDWLYLTAEGFEPAENTDPATKDEYPYLTGTLKVAQIGDVKYETLEAAIAAVTEGQTIKLLADVEVSSCITIQASKKFTLDLAGNKVSANSWICENYGDLTITDSVGDGEMIARGCVDNYGTLTVEGGKITAKDKNGGAAVWNNPGGTFKMNGGRLYVQEADSTGMANTPHSLVNEGNAIITGGTLDTPNNRGYAIKNNSGTLEITPAEGKEVTVSGTHGGLAVDGGNATVNGGSFSSTNYYGLYVSNDQGKATVTVNGGEFSGKTKSVLIGSDTKASVDSVLTITGGVFNQEIAASEKVAEDGLQVSGGTFAAPVPEEYCADGFIPKTNDDGTYGVKEGAYVAEIGDAKYETLEAAIAAVPADGTKTTIKLLAGVELTKTVTIAYGKNVVLDMNNQDITSTVLAIKNQGDLEITGTGKITVNGTKNTLYGINNNGASASKRANLIVGENVSVTAPCVAVNTQYATSTLYGTFANTQADSNNVYSTLKQSSNSEVIVAASATVTGQVNAIYGDKGTLEVNSTNVGKIYADGSSGIQGLKIKKTTAADAIEIVGHAEFSDDAEYYVAAKALSACTGTVKLLSDVNGSLAVIAGKTVTLDLNGHKVTAVTYPIEVSGNLTITGEGTVQSTGMGSATSVQAAVYVKAGGQLTILSGNFVAGHDDEGNGNAAVYVLDNALVSIEGGDFVGGSTYLLNKLDSATNAVVTVTGGSFHNFNPADNSADGEHTNYVAEGYEAVEDNGVWTVVECAYVAQIGEVKYESLEAALAASKSGDTVVLLQDVEKADYNMILDAGRTLDLNGYKLTISMGIVLGDIADTSAENSGKIVVAKDRFVYLGTKTATMNANQVYAKGTYYIPAYDTDGYKFINVRKLWEEWRTDTADAASFLMMFVSGDPKLAQAFTATSGVEIGIKIGYVYNDLTGEAFEFSNEQVAELGTSMVADASTRLAVHFVGLASKEYVTAQPYLKAANGSFILWGTKAVASVQHAAAPTE